MKINTLNSLTKFLNEQIGMTVYRGHRETTWLLESTIDRIIKKNSYLSGKEDQAESSVIQSFLNNAHLFDPSFNTYKDHNLSLMAYIQHHGAPTRLLDTTVSKFVALFFAFDDVAMNSKSKYSRIWCIDRNKLWEKTAGLLGINKNDLLNKYEDVWDKYILQDKYEAIFYLEPKFFTKTSHMQKGGFICSGKRNIPVHEIYAKQYTDIITYVDINKNLHHKVNELLEVINMSYRTLFGGVNGFAKDMTNTLLNLHMH